MREIVHAVSEDLDKQFPEGVAEPKNPSEFLLKLLGTTQDMKYSDDTSAEHAISRDFIQSAFIRIESIAADIAKIYKDIYSREFEHDPGEIRIYVVGGRIKKDLGPSSDLDIVLTVEKPHPGLNLDSAARAGLVQKYRVAEKEFDAAIKTAWEAYGISVDFSGKTKKLWLDIHDRGLSEEEARREWAEKSNLPYGKRRAVLVYKC